MAKLPGRKRRLQLPMYISDYDALKTVATAHGLAVAEIARDLLARSIANDPRFANYNLTKGKLDV